MYLGSGVTKGVTSGEYVPKLAAHPKLNAVSMPTRSIPDAKISFLLLTGLTTRASIILHGFVVLRYASYILSCYDDLLTLGIARDLLSA